MRFHVFASNGAATATRRRSRRRLRAALAAAALAATTGFVALPASAGEPPAGIDLHVTLGTDLSDGACGGDTQLDVTRLDQVNFCYTVTNRSDTTLRYQTLEDDVVGTILSAIPLTLAPGASHQFNRIVTARDSQSPLSTWTADDVHPGYDYANAAETIFSDGFDGIAGGDSAPYDFIDITATGTPLDLKEDDLSVQADIGFPFTFYGQTATQLMVAYNGGLLFDLDRVFLTPTNTPLPNADIGPAILAYWTDIYYQQPEDGNIYYQTLGSAPNRRFVAEWFNLPIMIGGIQQDSATFEVVLHEGSNDILFQYADTSVGDPARDNGITTTIGLNAPIGVPASLQYSYKQASVGAGKAILFSPTTPTTFSANQQVELAVGVPKITVAPGQFGVFAAAGATTSGTLTIGNIGNRPLQWNINSVGAADRPTAPATAHRTPHPFGDATLTSALPAPNFHRSHTLAERSAAPQPLAEPVPAFGVDMDAGAIVSLDAADPDALSPIGSIGDLILTAGAFVDEGFGKLYVFDYYTNHLLTIDTASGAIDLVGSAELPGANGISWSALAWDPTTTKLYAIAYSQSRDGNFSYLYTIDPVTAAPTLIGPVSRIGVPGPGQGTGTLISGLAVDTTGHMYGIDLVADEFVEIDKTSGAGTSISSIGFDANYSQGLDFDDYTGTLYYAAFNNSAEQAVMYTIDPTTGSHTQVSLIGADPSQTQLTAFAIARLAGACAYPESLPWLRFTTTRGSTEAGDSTPIGVTFDATNLDAGTYHGNVCVTNNDATNRRVAVPVTFTVN